MKTPAKLTLIIILSLAAASRAAGNDDVDLRQAVEIRLYLDPLVNANDIDVHSEDGLIQLRGRVQNLVQKQRASELAETRRGVRSVVNLLEVVPVPRADDVIAEDVENALNDRPGSETYEIDATVVDGVVTLTGEVGSWSLKQLAATIAAGVLGVRDVVNEIDVHYAEGRDDEEIRKHIELRLVRNVWTRAAGIEIEVADGEVVLSGWTGSLEQRREVERLVWVSGVKTVDTSKVVVSPLANDPNERSPFAAISDAEIHAAIEDAIVLDPRIRSFNLDVDVRTGRVVLFGQVSTLAGKRAADEIVRNTAGVYHVSNFLKVRPEVRPSDDELAERLRRTLASDSIVSSFRIDVRTRDGQVWLTGEVDSAHEKIRAEDVAAEILGVTEVTNLLSVAEEISQWRQPSPAQLRHASKSGQELKEAVEQELYWSWNVDSDRIEVAVREGTVILTGEVGSAVEFRAAELQAHEAGASWVENRLVIAEPKK